MKSFKSHIVKKQSILPRNRDRSRINVVKGGCGGERDTTAISFNTKGIFPSRFFLLYLSTKFSLLKIWWDPVRFCSCVSPGWCFAAYKSLTSLPTLECAVCRREGACSSMVTSQAAKCEFLSKYQNHPSPNPNTSPVIREKEKNHWIFALEKT